MSCIARIGFLSLSDCILIYRIAGCCNLNQLIGCMASSRTTPDDHPSG
uniref:Uncharacterized protein n=1 Tax=Arundo donax TaxID=35708 RepID=A0A0A9E1D8_ARUDO